MSKELDNQRFKVGDKIKLDQNFYQGTITRIGKDGILQMSNPQGIELFCHSEHAVLDNEKTDNQTKNLRDVFALAALPALVKLHHTKESSLYYDSSADIARYAYNYANEMLKARESISEQKAT